MNNQSQTELGEKKNHDGAGQESYPFTLVKGTCE